MQDESSTVATILVRGRGGILRAEAIVDAHRYPEFAGYRWNLNHDYATRCEKHNGKARTIWLHREVMRLDTGDRRRVDHINRNPLDNREANLRIATQAENLQNVTPRKGCSSRHRGVDWYAPSRKWRAAACIHGKRYHLGYFEDEGEAAHVAAEFRARQMPFSEDARG